MATGVVTAVQAATASLVVIMVPVVLTWATASYSQAPWGQAVRAGVAVWLLAHHTGIAIPGGHFGLVPIGLLLIPLITCWIAGVRLARTLDPNAEAIRDGIGRARPRVPPTRALFSLVFTYAGLVTLAAVLATSVSVRPLVAQAFLGSASICCLGAAGGVGAWTAGGVLRGVRRVIARSRLPLALRRCLRPLVLALAVQFGGATVILLAALVTGWHRVMGLQHALSPGIVGGLVLLVTQLTAVPNLLVWCGAWSAGPGFAVGTGTSVTPDHTHLGALPAVPLLGVLPTPGDVPAWGWAVLSLPVVAGLLVGWWIVHRGAESFRTALRDCGLTALLAGGCWAVLGWLSGGPAGPGRLAQFGPSAWELGLTVAVEVGLGAVLAVGAGFGGRMLAAPSTSTRPRTPSGPSTSTRLSAPSGPSTSTMPRTPSKAPPPDDNVRLTDLLG